jgi:3-phenylpropionate/cinnamic acid dioxygenase small subunit
LSKPLHLDDGIDDKDMVFIEEGEKAQHEVDTARKTRRIQNVDIEDVHDGRCLLKK